MVRVCVLLILLAGAAPAAAQSRDWSGELTLFGSSADELAPALALAPAPGLLHAFCICADSLVALKRTRDSGVSWSAVSLLSPGVDAPRVSATADGSYNYALVYSPVASPKRLYRFTAQSAVWDTALVTVAPLQHGHVLAATLTSDALTQGADPYLNLCWMERDSASTDWQLWFAQSRDRGQSFRAERQLCAGDHLPTFPLEIALAAASLGETERLFVAVPVERLGAVPEQVCLFRSDDQGDTWAATPPLDSTTRAQTEPALAAFDSVVIAAFTRGGLASLPDVAYCFSTDGGNSFSPITLAAAGSAVREHSPRLVIDAVAHSFCLFYLVDSLGQEESTLWLRSGSLFSPDSLGAPLMLCGSGAALATGGVAVAASLEGVAAAWPSRFQLGDIDIHFDASWRGADVALSPLIPAALHLGEAYPNPFNGLTTLPLELARPARVTLDVYDLLGRRVFDLSLGRLPPGQYRVPLDFAALPSGVYWLRARGLPAPPARLILLR